MLTRLIKTKWGALLLRVLGVGAACGAAAFALVLVTPLVGVFQVLGLLLVSAALVKASAVQWQRVGTRAFGSVCCAGRPSGRLRFCGKRAALSACTH